MLQVHKIIQYYIILFIIILLFYGTRRFLTALIRTRHLSASWTRSI